MRATKILMTLLAAAPMAVSAQVEATDPGDDIAVAVVVPPTMPGVDPAAKVQLESRLSQFLTGTGFAAVPGGSTLVLYPSLVVLEERVVEGMQNRTVVRLDLSLFLKNAADGVLFASTSVPIAGAGPSRNAAIINAVSTLRGGDPAMRDFTTSARARINEYYASNCESVITEGTTYAGTGDIERAMAILLSVPRESRDCYGRSTGVAVDLYADYQEKDCRIRLQRARAESAVDHFIGAIDALEGIDPSSGCSTEADALLSEIGREVAEQKQAAIETRLEVLRMMRAAVKGELVSAASISTRRLTLAAAARVEWLNRQPRPAFGPELFRK